MQKVFSSDIFDTLLTRIYGSPKSTFYFLGKKFRKENLIDLPPEVFARLRARAESRAFANSGGLDSNVSLQNIYDELGFMLDWDKSFTNKLLKEEVLFELHVLVPIKQNTELIRSYREKGFNIAFLSDMYLSGNEIKTILRKHDVFQEQDILYVSNEHSASKSSGKLYNIFLNKQKVSKKNIQHIGNSRKSDFIRPTIKGIKATFFAEGNFNRYEKTLDSFSYETDGYTAALAGASRIARLSFVEDDLNKQILREVAAGVAAPTLVSIVLWTFRYAQNLGLNRLYYISRDGQVLYKIAKILVKKLSLDLEIRYLYGSRHSWVFPSITSDKGDFLRFIFQHGRDVDFQSIRLMLDRIDIKPEEIEGHLHSIGIEPDQYEHNLSPEKRKEFHKYCLENKELRRLILIKSSKRRKILLDYLKQEDILKDNNFGLIDLGQNATLHNAISSVLHSVGKPTPRSLYLAAGKEHPEFGQPFAFIRKNSDGKLGIQDVPRLVTGIEMFCSADHGTVKGYEIDPKENKIIPVLKESSNEPVINWGFLTVKETILKFTEILELDLINQNNIDFKSCIKPIFEIFFQTPTKEEAKVWGNFPMEDGWGDFSIHKPIVEPIKLNQLISSSRSNRHVWGMGSLKITKEPLRSFLKAGILLQNFINKVRKKIR